MSQAQRFIASIKASIVEIAAVDVTAAQAGGAVVIDIREREEYLDGALCNTQWIPRGRLETQIESTVPDSKTRIVLYCAGGTRSALAARTLAEIGYTHVESMAGGFSGYKAQGLPWVVPVALTAEQGQRFARHLRLPEVGEAGQHKLLQARVLVVGAGGLGSPCALYLAAAGVGTIGLIDDDVVDESNLQRQILHTTGRVGMRKVDSAEVALRELWPQVKVEKHAARLNSGNAHELLASFDVIVDGSDNFATRYLINDVALLVGKPVVHASVFRFEGQLTMFAAGGKPCYRCIFPTAPPPGHAPSCSEAGVLGVLPGVLGVLQATEALKVVLGIGETLAGRLIVYDALSQRFMQLAVNADPRCPVCSGSQ
jgi:sulfur-carrier protein adenylyltransferase/sulfurtransferase